ncbi:MAG: hypothetical protein ACTS4V_01570 [Candidatus Hodgkinia cicadicola]
MEDALNATKLAITSGGGRRYRWSHFYKSPKLFQQPLTIVPSALVLRLQAPARQMITNAGLDKILIVNKLLQSTESHFERQVYIMNHRFGKVTK